MLIEVDLKQLKYAHSKDRPGLTGQWTERVH